MKELEATAVLVALFALRCIAPLVFTITIAYLMNRLVDRWRVEDEFLLQEERLAAEKVRPAADIKSPVVTIPCWILRNCEESMQSGCAARKQPGLPCWLVRLRYDGALPETCPACPIYAQDKAIAVIA